MKSMAVSLIMLPTVALSEPADESGGGQFDILVSGAQLSMALVISSSEILNDDPNADVSSAQVQMAKAISDLGKPLELFVPSPEAGCVTLAASVALSGEGLEPRSEALTPSPERDFRAEYLVECRDIGRLTAIRFDYFERFPMAQHLDVGLTGAGAANRINVTRADPALDFPAIR